MPTADDRRLAMAALEKRRSGRKPSRAEEAALRRVNRQRDDELREEHYHNIPAKLWRSWSGRQTKTIKEQAQRYGIPFGGAVIDLERVVFALHEFLRKNHRRLSTEEEDQPKDATLEAKRREDVRLLRLKRRQIEGRLIELGDIREGLGVVAGIFRRAAENLQRHYGPDAGRVLEEACDAAEREIRRRFGADADE